MRIAAPKDRAYLETLNLKALQKGRKPAEGQPAREFYEALQQEATDGPLFGPDVLRTIEHLPELPKVVTKWLGNLKDFKDVDARDLNLVIDWVSGDRTATQELPRLTWKQAVEAQQYWHEHEFKVQEHGEYKTHDVVFSTGGYDFVEITDQDDLETEGRLMGHCVGRPEYADAVKSGRSKIYSLRDSSNRPHVTIEVDVHGKLVKQCYGKQNNTPVHRYNDALVKFFGHMKLLDGVLHLKNVDIPDTTWRSLGKSRNVEVLLKLAQNEDTPADVLADLTRHAHEDVRMYAAMNPNTPLAYVTPMTQDSDDYVRLYAARRHDLPLELVNDLARSDDYAVRSGIAANKSTPANLLVQLAGDTDTEVRMNVVRNWNTPIRVLEQLAQDVDSVISMQARLALKARS